MIRHIDLKFILSKFSESPLDFKILIYSKRWKNFHSIVVFYVSIAHFEGHCFVLYNTIPELPNCIHLKNTFRSFHCE